MKAKIQPVNFPFISIITVTYNVENKIKFVLKSLGKQKYPRNKMEIIIVDGGSFDNTLKILSKSKLPIRVINGKYKGDQEARRAVGLEQAKGDIVAYIDSDNYLPHPFWLQKMVLPFIQHPGIVGAFTLRYGYRKNDNLLNRYFSLLGSADPVDHFLGKGERLSYLYNKWNRYGKIILQKKDYFLVQFDSNLFPTLGANGFLARKGIWKRCGLTPKTYVHVDAAYVLSLKGYNLYAIVKDSIIHDTATTLISFIKKRVSYISFYRRNTLKRKYKVFDISSSHDLKNLILFIFYSVTFIGPLIFAIRGYFKKNDLAWFMHPFFCFTVSIIYSYAILLGIITNGYKKTINI